MTDDVRRNDMWNDMWKRIGKAERFEELRACRDEATALLGDPRAAADIAGWNEVVNHLHDLLIGRTVFLSERMLAEKGLGPPPVRYAFVLFGSGGRSEQTPWSDQDNGLLYADGGDPKETEDYFHLLVGSILHGLGILGYPPCQGNVLCSNPRWRKPLSDWKRRLNEWFGDPTWENVRYTLIVADARAVYGDASLVRALAEDMRQKIRERPDMLGRMLKNTLHHKVALNWFGRLVTERYGEDAGGFDVKYGAYLPIVNGVRLLALAHGVAGTSTLERIAGLTRIGVLSPAQESRWRDAFLSALLFRAEAPFQLQDGLYTTRGKLRDIQLTRQRRRELKECLLTGKAIQQFVRRHISAVLARSGKHRK